MTNNGRVPEYEFYLSEGSAQDFSFEVRQRDGTQFASFSDHILVFWIGKDYQSREKWIRKTMTLGAGDTATGDGSFDFTNDIWTVTISESEMKAIPKNSSGYPVEAYINIQDGNGRRLVFRGTALFKDSLIV